MTFKVISSFDHDGKKYHLVYPTVKVTRESNFRHRKVFTDALKDGFYTKKKLELILQEGEINVIKDHIDRRSLILQEYYKASELVTKTDTPEELEWLADILKSYRESYIQEDMAMNSLFANTVEQLAEDERINFLAYSLVKNEDFSSIWATYDDFSDDSDYIFIERCKYEVLRWEYNLTSESPENQPETKALKKAQELRSKAASINTALVEAVSDAKEGLELLPVKGKRKLADKHSTKASKKSSRQVTDYGESDPIG